MKKLAPFVLVATLSSCFLWGDKTASDERQLLNCVFGSAETDATLLAKICRAAPKLIPIVSDLIGQREAGVVRLKDAGAQHPLPSDAGADAR